MCGRECVVCVKWVGEIAMNLIEMAPPAYDEPFKACGESAASYFSAEIGGASRDKPKLRSRRKAWHDWML